MSEYYNTGYEVLLITLITVLSAQILKFVLNLLLYRKVDFKLLTTTGGMPSSHSASVVSLSTAVGFISGFDSTVFAVATGYAFVVMYVAAGLRRASGKMAVCLNKIMDDFYKHNVQEVGGKLKELLGHTPIEVFAGALFGFFMTYYFHFMVFGV